MSLTFEKFCENCLEIEAKTRCLPGHEWILSTNNFNDLTQVYLYHKRISRLGLGTVTCEYHVTYSESYANPVLYFNVWHQNGKLLTLDEVLECILKLNKNQTELDRLSVVTQQEHPTFHRPWFVVHPCKTKEFMSKLETGNNIKNYVLAWLSCISTLVGFDLPLCLAL